MSLRVYLIWVVWNFYFRPDIDGTADIVEEIVRIYGYDKIKPQSVIKDPRIKKEILNGKLKSFYK